MGSISIHVQLSGGRKLIFRQPRKRLGKRKKKKKKLLFQLWNVFLHTGCLPACIINLTMHVLSKKTSKTSKNKYEVFDQVLV